MYNAQMSRRFQMATSQSVQASHECSGATRHEPSLAATDPDQLGRTLARLLLASPPIHDVGATSPRVDGRRQRRPVDRSASDPAPSSPPESCRYKTELCRPFEENGACKYGDKCQFAHGRAELRPVARHPKYKTDLCKTYHTTGLCPYGPRCHFIHNDDERHLNELNRVVIEQQRALVHRKQVLDAAATLVRLRQQAVRTAAASRGSVASRSPSPPPSYDQLTTTMPARPASCGGDKAIESTASALAALGRRVRQAAPQMTDSELQAVVSRLLMGAVLSDPSASNTDHCHRRHPHHIQFQQQQQQQQRGPYQQRSAVQSAFNADQRLLAL